MVRSTWILSIFLLMLSACLPQSRARIFTAKHNDCLCPNIDALVAVDAPVSQSVGVKEKKDNGVNYRLRALTLEAKFNDIPVPFGSEPISDFFMQEPDDTHGIVFGYTNISSIAKLYEFFKAECISFGWRFIGGMSGIETMLIFEKPDRACAISLRPLEDSTAIIITVCPKNSEV